MFAQWRGMAEHSHRRQPTTKFIHLLVLTIKRYTMYVSMQRKFLIQSVASDRVILDRNVA